MWPVHCADCEQLILVDCRQITAVDLAPGAIAVEVQCPLGHLVPVLTGRATEERPWTRRS